MLLLIIFTITYYENIKVKDELYSKKMLDKFYEIDKKLDSLSIKYNTIKVYEFSIKLSKNKVSNKRYIYGVSSETELDRNIIKEIGISNEFQKITNNFLDNNNEKLRSIGFSQDMGISADRIYIEIFGDKKDDNKPSIISYEKINNQIYIRQYRFKDIDDYLENKLNSSGDFGRIIKRYLPSYKFNNDGYKYYSSKLEKVESIRILLNEYNTVYDLRNLILELANYFNISDMIEVKKWIYHFSKSEINMIGITFSPVYNICFYNREVTEYDNQIKYE